MDTIEIFFYVRSHCNSISGLSIHVKGDVALLCEFGDAYDTARPKNRGCVAPFTDLWSSLLVRKHYHRQ